MERWFEINFSITLRGITIYCNDDEEVESSNQIKLHKNQNYCITIDYNYYIIIIYCNLCI